LSPIASRVANQAIKGALGDQVQKLIDAQVARATAPLLTRIEELERRIAALEGGRPAPRQTQTHRPDDV
jgi:hypothetical protein